MTAISNSITTHAAQEVTQFGREVGIDLQLDETGNCYFEHRDGLRMAIMLTGDDQIVTAAALFSEVNISQEQVCNILTEFNWLGTRVNGATLSWNPEAHNFLLWYSRDANAIKMDDLSNLLTRLIKAAHMIKPDLEARISEPDQNGTSKAVDSQKPVDWIAQRA